MWSHVKSFAVLHELFSTCAYLEVQATCDIVYTITLCLFTTVILSLIIYMPTHRLNVFFFRCLKLQTRRPMNCDRTAFRVVMANGTNPKTRRSSNLTNFRHLAFFSTTTRRCFATSRSRLPTRKRIGVTHNSAENLFIIYDQDPWIIFYTSHLY